MVLPLVSGKEVCRALMRAGFSRKRQKGSYVKMRHADGRNVVPAQGARPGDLAVDPQPGRLVPVPARAASALDEYLRDSRPRLLRELREEALFLSLRGRRLGVTGLTGLVRSHAEAAGISRPVSVTPCGTPTALYTRVAGEDLRKAIAR
jgi:predicted RNA binding protein YcfA (HicA-like mRNA interferase family)